MQTFAQRNRGVWGGLLFTAAALVLVTAFAPLERTLGERARLVYFHGAWVWAGKLAFAAASLAGLVGLLRSNHLWQKASQAVGYTGLFFWLTYLPLSVYVQVVNWGGIFWEEPRWRIPLMLGIVGVLLQVGLALLGDLRLTSIANMVYGVALWGLLRSAQNVLHPDSPILTSDSLRIQIFFAILLALSVIFGMLIARLLYAGIRSQAE